MPYQATVGGLTQRHDRGEHRLIKVLVADDHDLVRAGIVSMLKGLNDMHIVGEAVSGEEALSRTRELRPDIVLMDVRMPGIGGLEATRKLVRQYPDTRVIAVTACDDDPFPSRLLKAGAAGFVTKGSAPQEMVNAIRAVVRGQRYISPEIAQKLALRTVGGGEPVDSPFDMLSERELQICMMVVSCHKAQDIAEKLHLSPKTVNSYRYRIFEKLGIDSDVQLTLLAIRHSMIDAPQSGG